MTLEQARSVMWLRNYHRPLGDLLDEGYLDQDRLEWVAQNAYDPQLKEAAALLLAWSRQTTPEPKPAEPPPAVNAGLSLEQARATLWPFPPFKNQPMGPLVDTQQLKLKDLAYAIENAWDDRVRRAAIALMAVSLNQAVEEPPPSAGPLKVVSYGRSYAERQQLRQMLFVGLFAGAALMVALLIMIDRLLIAATSPLRDSSWLAKATSPTGLVALAFLIGLSAIAIILARAFGNWTSNRLEQRMAAYRQGQEGETRVVEVLCHVLDGSWTLFRNVNLPGYRADLDLVLVGPAGVWALEVKTLTGEYRNIGENWEFRAGKRWRPLKKSPSRQARNNAGRLGDFLRADKVKQWVEAAVVWANPESPLAVDNPMVTVWTLDRLPDELGNLWQDRKVDESSQARIVEKLTRLCQSGGWR
jgi:hypothetical protein